MADEDGLTALGLRQELDVQRFIDFASAIEPPVHSGMGPYTASVLWRSLASPTIKIGVNNPRCPSFSMELYLNKKEYVVIRFMAAAWSWYQVWGIFRNYQAEGYPLTRRLWRRFVAGNGEANA